MTPAHVIALDLGGLTFVDSTGIRLILHAQRRSAEGGNRLTVVRGTDAVQRLVDICGVTTTLPFIDELPASG